MSLASALLEILNLAILVVVIGFIISGYVRSPKKRHFELRERKLFDWDDFLFGVLIAAPGIVIHELAHKFLAIGFGASATFQLFPLGLALGIILRLVRSPFLILAPGFVVIGNEASISPLDMGMIAFAGPLINLVLWLVPMMVLRIRKRKLKRNVGIFLFYTSFLNMWLFIFNMIPIPPLDGSKVLLGLINALS